MKKISLLLFVAALFPMVALTAEKQVVQSEPDGQKKEIIHVSLLKPVAYPTGSSNKVKQLATKLCRELGAGHTPIEVHDNPVCCLWLEIDHWQPDPAQGGYVIIVQQGGSKITATDDRQLELAVDHLLKLRKKEGDQVQIPVGLITSYPVVERAEDAGATAKACDPEF